MLEKYVERVVMTKGIPDIIALGAGAYKGFCDAQQIPLHSDFVKYSLILAPTAIHTTLGGFIGFMLDVSEHEKHNTIKEGLIGAATGATETGMGYCIGHTLGSLMK